MFDLAGSIGADVMIVDPAAPSYVEKGWDEARLFSRLSVTSMFSNGTAMVPLVISTFSKMGPAQGFLQILADVASSTCVVDRGLRLRIAQQYLSCALVQGRGIVFCHYYQSIAKVLGKTFVMVLLSHLSECGYF